MELNYRFANRLRVREVSRILLENQEDDIWVIVWPQNTTATGVQDKRYITVSILPRDQDFVLRLLAVDGVASVDNRETMLRKARLWQEMYQGQKVRQFAAWTR